MSGRPGRSSSSPARTTPRGRCSRRPGSWLTNKYAEGQPGKRYYGGCEYVDVVERLAEDRALALFPGAEFVNVQPHSGAQANIAAYVSVLEHGDRILGMSLAHGGHLTHGHPINFSGRNFEVHATGSRRSTAASITTPSSGKRADVRPRLIVAGASAYPRIIDFERMARIAHDVEALLFVDMAHIAGLVAAGLHPSPFPHADIVTTTTHKTLRGPRGGLIFGRAELGKQIDRAVFPGTQGGPLMHVIAAKAVALLEAQGEDFREYQQRTLENAVELADTLRDHGAALVSGGTDNHLMLVDVTPLGVTGAEAEHLLDEVGITVNKNAIPFDPLPPNTASGIRVGIAGHHDARLRRAPRCARSVSCSCAPCASADDAGSPGRGIHARCRAICARFPVPGLPDA